MIFIIDYLPDIFHNESCGTIRFPRAQSEGFKLLLLSNHDSKMPKKSRKSFPFALKKWFKWFMIIKKKLAYRFPFNQNNWLISLQLQLNSIVKKSCYTVRSVQERHSQSNDTVKWLEKISNAQSLIKPAGGNLHLITASLLLTALTAMQPAGKSNGHLNSRSISRPVSLVWLGRVPWCQPVCWCRRSTLAISHIYSTFKSQ